MILIITHKKDFTADYVVNKLNELKKEYFRFNCEDYLNYDIKIEFSGRSKCRAITINGIGNFTSVWYRRTMVPELEVPNLGERLYLISQIEIFLQNLLGILEAKWLNIPSAVDKAENKFLQLSIAQTIGLNIPETLATTTHKTLQEFLQTHKKLIIKPMGSGRINISATECKLIFTNIIEVSKLDDLENYDMTPAIYQNYIEKEYELRVTIVGQDVFAAKVDSQRDVETMVDWRRKKIAFTKYHFPKKEQEKCLTLLKNLNLSFGALDFIKGKDGQYYFLEINPNGQWVWIENDTEMPISNSIITYLS